MRYYIDTEFLDTGSTLDLVSIGIVAEDGRELYLESADVDRGKANQWVREHVFPQLWGGECRWPLQSIKATLLDFFDIKDYGKPELWGWCSGYDWVVFCQIFGTMMDVPEGFPHYMRDIQYILDERGIADEDLPSQEEGIHHALADARYLKKLWGYVQRNDAWQ